MTMDLLAVGATALLASLLTLYSGFGLGTLLLPVFALFFPVEIAVALTAVVHFVNNLFKLAVFGRHGLARVVLLFGGAAVPAAWLGAHVQTLLAGASTDPIHLAGREVEPVKLVVGALMIVFAVLESARRLEEMRFGARMLPLGGLLSGFFGGLSGHQGALRSAFLVRTLTERAAFVATTAWISSLVDVTRLAVYGSSYGDVFSSDRLPPLAAGAFGALGGVLLGRRMLPRVTMRGIRLLVAVLLLAVGGGLALGFL
jgi:uncharacterized membrane protein YfcA